MNIYSVAISELEPAVYPAKLPYLPPKQYPEFTAVHSQLDPQNFVYQGVRDLFVQLGLDKDNYGTTEWNPLGTLILPGQKVLIKPNWVRDFHVSRLGLDVLVTHASIIRAVLDYAAMALQGDGEITVGDAPLQGANFINLMQMTEFPKVLENVQNSPLGRGINFRLVDFRKVRGYREKSGIIEQQENLPGDDKGYTAVAVDERSFLAPIEKDFRKFRVTNYHPDIMLAHHREGKHEYLVTRSLLEADVVINLPKMKTHRKAGVTLSLKNMVGINGSKDWLPHHRIGSTQSGGDEFEKSYWKKSLYSGLVEKEERTGSLMAKRFYHLLRKSIQKSDPWVFPFPEKIREGNWPGNDTVWRMVLDLNQILFFADKEGLVQQHQQRKYLSLIDGIIAGDGNGPLDCRPRSCGILLAGINPWVVDRVAVAMMGFDYRKIPLMVNGWRIFPEIQNQGLSSKIKIYQKDSEKEELSEENLKHFSFETASDWESIKRKEVKKSIGVEIT